MSTAIQSHSTHITLLPWLLITDVGFHEDQWIHIKTTLWRFKHLPRSEALHRIPGGKRPGNEKDHAPRRVAHLSNYVTPQKMSSQVISKILLLKQPKSTIPKIPNTFSPSLGSRLKTLSPAFCHLGAKALPGTSFPLSPVAHHGRFLLPTAIPGGSVSSNKGVYESNHRVKLEQNDCFLLEG